ncbi:hypothetical protein QA596_07045 [Balneolales bacterium ANBcel1]|nr:hypothetical protein [Balneolales bacterium ANBcel1]
MNFFRNRIQKLLASAHPGSERGSDLSSPGSAAVPFSIGITSMALIAFQLVIMQILSITQWHHFAYMVISMAMLGFGAAGTFLALFREWMNRHFDTALPVLYLLCGVSMAAAGWMAGVFGDFDAFLLFFERSQIGVMIFSYLVYCLPFFFGGLAITLVFYRQVSEIGTIYFFNLGGSALGGVVAIALFWLMPLPETASLLSLLVLFAAWLVRLPGRRFTVAIVLSLLVPLAGFIHPVVPQTSEYKAIYGALQLPEAEVTFERSSPYGLLQVVSAPAQRFAPSLSLQYRDAPPVRDVVFNNGEYFGTLLGKSAQNGSHILDYSTRGLPFAVRRPDTMVVLHAATGTDVSHGVHHGVSRIHAVEPHRRANHLLTQEHPQWNDSLYHQPGVSLHGNSVRSWMAANPGLQTDLIILPVIGAFGGTSGLNALQEQNHLTLEAFHEMWDRLAPHGMIASTIWTEHPARATLKLPATWRRLLDERGISRPGDHIMAIRSWGTITYMLSRSPFTEQERETARRFSEERSFDPLFLADIRPEERDRFNRTQDRSFFDHVDTLLVGNPDSLFDSYVFDVRPATDNRPFFSHSISWSSIPELRDLYGDDQLPYMELGFVMAGVTLVQIVLASVVLILLPLFRVGWQGTRRRWTFLYFAGIGTGFMFFEMVLIQKLVLYLGQPVYATAAVLAALLLFSGTGSYASSRFTPTRRILLRTGGTIVALVLAYSLLLMPLLDISMSWPLVLKIISVTILLAPPAFFMGMMFPFGLRLLSGSNASQIPWACGIDSCLSVSATALATLVALESGFGVVMGIAAASYALTTLAGMRIRA